MHQSRRLYGIRRVGVLVHVLFLQAWGTLSNNIIHPYRLNGFDFGSSCFGRVMMSVTRSYKTHSLKAEARQLRLVDAETTKAS